MPEYTLHLGDCINLLQELGDNEIPLCVTDIPYGVINRKDSGLRKLSKEHADVPTFSVAAFLDALVPKISGSIYIFCATEQVSEIRATLVEKGLTTRLGVWEKSNPSPMNGEYLWLSSVECIVFGRKRGATFNRKCSSPVFRYPVPRKTGHPTPKPIKLCEEIILASSVKGDTVLDPCMGGGNIGIAALNTGRNFIGMEIHEPYFMGAKQHMEERTKCLN